MEDLEKYGVAVVRGALGAAELAVQRCALEPLLAGVRHAGLRSLTAKSPVVARLSQSADLRALVTAVLGPGARLVRSILFNKGSQANWQVSWHQDLSIAVAQRREVPGFSAWSVKAGVPHVQPTVAILQQMLSLRLHLDPADASNGALWVSPGTHRLGRVDPAQAAAIARTYGKQLCEAAAGDILLFRPLLLHASWKATSPRPRRVIHLEFAGVDLPEPLVWHETENSV